MDTLKEIIKKFCDKYCLDFYENLRIEIIADISEYIQRDDLKYYYDRKEQIDNAIGMLYEDSNEQWIVLIKNQDEVNFLSTLIHEYVHFCDYKRLSKIRKNISFREMQEDYVFLFWTEFHATYLSYRFLIGMALTEIDTKAVQQEIVHNLIKYYSSSSKLDKNEAMDKTVRSYGSYIALYDEFFDEVSLYPHQYYYNKVFLEIYIFLKNHKTFDDFIIVYDNFKALLLEI